MILRLRFERDDLQRVRLCPAADPLWELLLAVQARASGTGPAGWRRVAPGAWAGPLGELIPVTGAFPDFLTPGPLPDVDAGCAAVAALPRARFRRDLALAFRGRAVTGWTRELAGGGRAEVRELVGALRRGHDALLAGHWGPITRTVAADRTARAATLAEHGVSALLTGVPGVLGWDGETLLLRYPVSRTVRLGGRGLTLVPSYFCAGTPVALLDPDLPPVLVYPARGTEPPPGPTPALAALLSATRAEFLGLAREPRTTTQLALRLGVSVGSASKQAAILRDTGLLASRRDGGAVVHEITALGAAVLTGRPEPR